MATIRNNKPAPLTLIYTGGRNGRIDLFPGVNLNIPDSEWEHARKHPITKSYLELNILEPLTTAPIITSELEGFTVVDHPKTDEPMPVSDGKVGKRPRVAKEN